MGSRFHGFADRAGGYTRIIPAGIRVGDGARVAILELVGYEFKKKEKKEKSVVKLPGINKATDVILKRGVIGSSTLSQWLDDIRNGGRKAFRTVTIQLQNEDHAVVATWKLARARIIKIVSGPFNAKGTDVAMEELTLACERL